MSSLCTRESTFGNLDRHFNLIGNEPSRFAHRDARQRTLQAHKDANAGQPALITEPDHDCYTATLRSIHSARSQADTQRILRLEHLSGDRLRTSQRLNLLRSNRPQSLGAAHAQSANRPDHQIRPRQFSRWVASDRSQEQYDQQVLAGTAVDVQLGRRGWGDYQVADDLASIQVEVDRGHEKDPTRIADARRSDATLGRLCKGTVSVRRRNSGSEIMAHGHRAVLVLWSPDHRLPAAAHLGECENVRSAPAVHSAEDQQAAGTAVDRPGDGTSRIDQTKFHSCVSGLPIEGQLAREAGQVEERLLHDLASGYSGAEARSGRDPDQALSRDDVDAMQRDRCGTRQLDCRSLHAGCFGAKLRSANGTNSRSDRENTSPGLLLRSGLTIQFSNLCDGRGDECRDVLHFGGVRPFFIGRTKR